MKIKTLIIIGLLVTLSGCMGIVPDNDLSAKEPSASNNGKKALANERHVKRMMAWINISTEQQ